MHIYDKYIHVRALRTSEWKKRKRSNWISKAWKAPITMWGECMDNFVLGWGSQHVNFSLIGLKMECVDWIYS